jgi:hypothetical protein
MNTPEQLKSNHLHTTIVQKLHPNRFARISTVMAAIVGFLVEEDFTEPAIADIIVTPKGVVVVRTAGEDSTIHILGAHAELLWNWRALLAAAGLTPSELIEAQSLFAAKIGFFGREAA